MYRLFSRMGAKASACTRCRACEDVCPQKLDITGALANLADLFD
jgi:predicted aldo/keto reductase-like oxidoreductase